MSEVRIWELAEELGLSAGEAVKELESLGVTEVTPLSSVDRSDAQRLRARVAERAVPPPDPEAGDPLLDGPVREAGTESQPSWGHREFEHLLGGAERVEEGREASGAPERAEAKGIKQREAPREVPKTPGVTQRGTSQPEVQIEPSGAMPEGPPPARAEAPVAARWEPGPREPRPFEEMLLILRLHRPMLILATLLMVALAVTISFIQEPLYESEASILVRPLPERSDPSARPLSTNMATETEILASEIVAQKVIEDLSLSTTPRELMLGLSVDTPRDTEILTIQYSHSDPLEAQHRAQSFAESYLANRREEATEGLAALTRAIEEELEILRQRVQDVNERLQAAETSDERNALQSQANLLQTLTLERELSLTSLLREPNVGGVVQPATLPRDPVRPDHPRNVGLGLLAGLALGVSLAFLKDYLDHRLRTRHEAELALAAPILATIPAVRGWRKRKPPLLVSARRPDSAAAEAYRALGMSVLSAVKGEGNPSLLVTASNWGEGATTTVANLGWVLSSLGFKIVVVSADLRRPRLHEFFGLPNSFGLTDVLTDEAPLEKVTQPVSPNLQLIASGSGRANPSELLSSDGMRSTLELAAAWADLILVDSAPIGPTSDPMILGRTIGNVLLVVGPLGTARDMVVASGEQLKTSGTHLIGGVVNNLDRSRMRGFVGS